MFPLCLENVFPLCLFANLIMKRLALAAAVALALAAPAAAENRRTKHRLASEEAGVKEETSAARFVAAKQASSFDNEMSKLNAELFPTEKKAVWHHNSPAEIRKHWRDESAATMGKGGDELSRKAAFAKSPKVTVAAGKAAVRADLAVNKKEALSAAEQAAAEIEHIKAVTEATFPTIKKAADDKQTAAQMEAVHASESDNVFPKRFAKQEAKGKHLMAKTVARVQKAQAELYGKLQARHHQAPKGIIKEANMVAKAQHRIAMDEKKARLAIQKQKAISQQHGAVGGKPRKGVAPNSWKTRQAQVQAQKADQYNHPSKKDSPASMGRKPISSDFAVPSDGTNVAFLGASQAGDKWFHGHEKARKSVQPARKH